MTVAPSTQDFLHTASQQSSHGQHCIHFSSGVENGAEHRNTTALKTADNLSGDNSVGDDDDRFRLGLNISGVNQSENVTPA
ncbi:hypothetical protein KCU86_g18167, partial [Aureobasidium melanogenum]